MKVLMICDDMNWVLGILAQKLASRFRDNVDITILSSRGSGFSSDLRNLSREHDVIHFLSPWDFFAGFHEVNLPIVLTVWHVVDWTPFLRHLWIADGILVSGHLWKSKLEHHVARNIPIGDMPFGIDTETFLPLPHARKVFLHTHQLAPDTVVFGVALSINSNQNDRKGLDRLWDVLRALADQLEYSVVLRIAGKGWSTREIPKDLEALVFVEPFMPGEELPHFYSSLDYYLCLSRVEGVPYPVLEAMSCGTVVLSTPVGVVPDLIQSGENGYIVEHISYREDVLKAVRQSVKNNELRATLGANARCAVISAYDWSAIVDSFDLQEFYAAAISQYRHRSLSNRLHMQFVHAQRLSAAWGRPLRRSVHGMLRILNR